MKWKDLNVKNGNIKVGKKYSKTLKKFLLSIKSYWEEIRSDGRGTNMRWSHIMQSSQIR